MIYIIGCSNIKVESNIHISTLQQLWDGWSKYEREWRRDGFHDGRDAEDPRKEESKGKSTFGVFDI